MVVSIGWFQIFTWKMVVSPNIHKKLVVWSSRYTSEPTIDFQKTFVSFPGSTRKKCENYPEKSEDCWSGNFGVKSCRQWIWGVGEFGRGEKMWGENHEEGIEYARWFKVTFLSPSWRSLDLWKGSLTIPKRAQRIARDMFFSDFLSRIRLR